MKKRCRWCNPASDRYIAYHDTEWGILSKDEKYLYEMLLLECFQAGLSWECILNKRDAFREAFDHFDPVKIASYGEDKIAALRENRAIIRCERKIPAGLLILSFQSAARCGQRRYRGRPAPRLYRERTSRFRRTADADRDDRATASRG